jgi:hypothetical protein
MVHSRPVIVFPFARTGKAALADAHDAKRRKAEARA